MILFADIPLAPDSLIAWGVVGILAGFLAGVVLLPGKYGVVADTMAGLAGAMLGGVLVAMLVGGVVGFLGSILVAALAACAFIAALRAVAPATHRP